MTLPWRLGQAASVIAAAAVLALLIVRPTFGLFVTWDVLIPLVPATLLLAPQVWRNLCPIAVVHQLPLPLGIAGGRRLPARAQRAAPAVAAALFYALVPLRPALFDVSGPALATTVLAVLVAAFVGALLITGKGGWCATWCPVLPVERMYGQQPLLDAPHAHCALCTGCVRSCYDLKPERSMGELLRAPAGRRGVLRSATGLFAAAFPGFVVGFFTVPDVGVLGTYGWIVTAAAFAALLTGAGQWATGAGDIATVRLNGALGAGLYYWFAIPRIVAATHDVLSIAVPPDGAILAAKVAVLLLPAYWLFAPRRPLPQGSARARRPASA